MTNLAINNQLLPMTTIAENILAKIQVFYGDQFTRRYGHLTDEQLIAGLIDTLDGLTPQDIQRGLNRMRTESWCPTMPEFRAWCLGVSAWWTAEMAWASALNYLADDTAEITTLAKHCLDKVKHIINNETQSRAHSAFLSWYEHYLERAKQKRKSQEMYVKPIMITHDDSAWIRKDHVPMPDDLKAKIKQCFGSVS